MAVEQQARIVDVAVGMILRPDGCLLLGNRPRGKPYEGWWELPGGKLEPGEDALQALSRELHEELGIVVTQATPWVTHVHVYPHATVRLAFCRVTAWEGEPRGMENQALHWVDPALPPEVIEASLGEGRILPATMPPLAWLQVPTTYAIGGPATAGGIEPFLQSVASALERGIRLFQFREPEWADGLGSASLLNVLRSMLALTRPAGARVLVSSAHPRAWWEEADGVHLRSIDLGLDAPADKADFWVGASTHGAEELDRARQAGARFAVLGPVLQTDSHPGAETLGWPRFAQLAAGAGLPVFALGGQSAETLQQAINCGAHGIAGIRNLLGGPSRP